MLNFLWCSLYIVRMIAEMQCIILLDYSSMQRGIFFSLLFHNSKRWSQRGNSQAQPFSLLGLNQKPLWCCVQSLGFRGIDLIFISDRSIKSTHTLLYSLPESLSMCGGGKERGINRGGSLALCHHSLKAIVHNSHSFSSP